jgi:hypothetical protein
VASRRLDFPSGALDAGRVKLGTRVKFVGGLWEGSFGVVVPDDEGLAEPGEVCVTFELWGRPATRAVSVEELVDASATITPLAEIEAAVREAVGRRGLNQRAFAWWVERTAEGADDLAALDVAERAFRAGLDAERAAAEAKRSARSTPRSPGSTSARARRCGGRAVRSGRRGATWRRRSTSPTSSATLRSRCASASARASSSTPPRASPT